MKPLAKFSWKSAACTAAMSAALATHALAAPSISSVTQTSEGGNAQLAISGSGFGSKAHAKPLYFFDFEGSNTAQNKNISFTTDSLNTNGTTTTSNALSGSGSALRFTIQQDSSAVAIPRIDFDSDRLYIFFNRMYDFSIADSSNWGSRGFNLKTNRLWSPDGNNIYIGYQGNESATSGRIYPEYTAAGGSTWVGSNLPQVANEWTQEEIIYKASDINTQNGRFDLLRNGNSAHNSSFRMRTSSYPSRYSQLYFDQISNGTNSSKSLHIYYDNIYVDDTYQRVYISDSSTFDQAKKRMIQVPVKWSDSNIVVNVNEGGIPLSNAYVYVVDSNGDANKNGAALCKSDCASPPNPPKSIDIQ